ncbi:MULTISPECIES: hypothetical protein [Ascidiaceihabitans]|uniref:Regulatory protein SoxS n=1 Tax=Ascidiaceihabitans donghaensis TaxID=1510460 RepID=A0A2R8BEL1_9RHOB|nr:hypothetical protein [Ascidiaceihabitans donghaensis]SPH21502.1 hypothetical protein ASD8599_02254 [Ascidiaceihabitans donghaensis]
MFFRRLFLAISLLTASVGAAWADTQLVMVEEKGCIWCARWNAEIAPIYPKTEEGAAAPLRRMDIRAKRPDDITFARSLTFTPTFVLVVEGQEMSRIEGYPGEDFFWGLLGKMLSQANVDISG